MTTKNDFSWLLEQASDNGQPALLTREVELLFMLLKAAETRDITFPIALDSIIYVLPGILYDESIRAKSPRIDLVNQTAQSAMKSISEKSLNSILKNLSSKTTLSAVLDGYDCEYCGWNNETIEVSLNKDRSCVGTLRFGCHDSRTFMGLVEDVISDISESYTQQAADIPSELDQIFSEMREAEYAWAVPNLSSIEDMFDQDNLWIRKNGGQ